MSAKLDVARMRGSVSRRCSSMPPPVSARIAPTPPTMMASHCLKAWLMPRQLEEPERGQEAGEVAEEDDEHADMEQHRAQDQLLAAQELARARLPGEGIALVAGDEPRASTVRAM